MDEKKIKNWHIYGIIFISIVGSLFHFTFELSGYNLVVGSFSAVNESVWEHLKLVFFPLMIFSLIEYRFIKDEVNNIAVGKALASYVMPLTIVIIFYSYEFLTGSHSFIVDISSFFIAIIVGQFVSYKILTSSEQQKVYSIIAWISIIALGLMFVIFTFYPPYLPIFQDSTSGLYGISNHSH